MPNQCYKCDKENIIQQLIKVQAQVTVTPLVKHGTPKIHDIHSYVKPNEDYSDFECSNYNCCDCYNFNHECYDCNCCGCNDYNCDYIDCNCPDYNRDTNHNEICGSENSKQKYNFTLTQVICVEIPISIDADVDIKEGIACCNKPDIKPLDPIIKNKPFYMPMI